MTSELHENIIDEIRQIVVNEYCQEWQPTLCSINYFASVLLGYGNEHSKPREPDLVIIPPDGAGAIAVEVGNMPDGKWREVISKDGKSIRVLRVGLDCSVSMIRQRYTKAEIALMTLLEERLEIFRALQREEEAIENDTIFLDKIDRARDDIRTGKGINI
jgi:hypothetical protein